VKKEVKRRLAWFGSWTASFFFFLFSLLLFQSFEKLIAIKEPSGIFFFFHFFSFFTFHFRCFFHCSSFSFSK